MRIDTSTLAVSVIVIIVSMIAGVFVPYYKITNDVENTLFTVSGIMFSIGLGLTVTSNTHGVMNKIYITEIRKNMSDCQSRFITLFLLLTLFYISLSYTDSIKFVTIAEHDINLNFRLAFAITSIYSIIFFITIFHSIQKFNEELEDRINEETHRNKVES